MRLANALIGILIFMGGAPLLCFGVDAYPFGGTLLYLGGVSVYDLKSRECIEGDFSKKNSFKDPYYCRLGQRWGQRQFYTVIDRDLEYVNSSDPATLFFFDFASNSSVEVCSTSKIGRSMEWYFPDRDLLVYSISKFNAHAEFFGKKGRMERVYYTRNIKTGAIKEALGTANVYIRQYRIDPSFSYTGAYMYYVSKERKLIELEVETQSETVMADLTSFLDSHKNDIPLILGPGSPDRKYVPIIAGKTLYILSSGGEIRTAASPFLGIFGAGAQGPIFWDKNSEYVIFSTRFGWLPSFDFRDNDIGYYSIKDGSVKKIETGNVYNHGIWYSWD
jgi:hypothetical protein